MAVLLLGPRVEEVGSELSGLSLKKFSFFLLVAPGLCCCEVFSLVASSRGYSRVAVNGLRWEAWAPGTGLQWLRCTGFSCPCGIWNLPGPGVEPMSPALAGGFSTTGPPGSPRVILVLSPHGLITSQSPRLQISSHLGLDFSVGVWGGHRQSMASTLRLPPGDFWGTVFASSSVAC